MESGTVARTQENPGLQTREKQAGKAAQESSRMLPLPQPLSRRKRPGDFTANEQATLRLVSGENHDLQTTATALEPLLHKTVQAIAGVEPAYVILISGIESR